MVSLKAVQVGCVVDRTMVNVVDLRARQVRAAVGQRAARVEHAVDW